jgi:hypothetical protein
VELSVRLLTNNLFTTKQLQSMKQRGRMMNMDILKQDNQCQLVTVMRHAVPIILQSIHHISLLIFLEAQASKELVRRTGVLTRHPLSQLTHKLAQPQELLLPHSSSGSNSPVDTIRLLVEPINLCLDNRHRELCTVWKAKEIRKLVDMLRKDTSTALRTRELENSMMTRIKLRDQLAAIRRLPMP